MNAALTHQGARESLVEAIVRAAENAVSMTPVVSGTPAVAAMLCDTARFCVLGGIPGLRRSLASIYAMHVVLFLGTGFKGTVRRNVVSFLSALNSSLAVLNTAQEPVLLVTTKTRVLVMDPKRFTVLHSVRAFDFGEVVLDCPNRLAVAPDGFVFVEEWGNARVHVLTPQLEFHAHIGSADQLRSPAGLCADANFVFVSARFEHHASVFSRADGALVRRFVSRDPGEAQLCYRRVLNLRKLYFGLKLRLPRREAPNPRRWTVEHFLKLSTRRYPLSLCILPRSGCVAVCDSASNGVDVFTVEGAFVRRVAKVRENTAIACTAFDEIVMTDFYGRVFVANERGDVVKQLRHGVAVFNDTVLVHTIDGARVELA
jgi:hypothetical protein